MDLSLFECHEEVDRMPCISRPNDSEAREREHEQRQLSTNRGEKNHWLENVYVLRFQINCYFLVLVLQVLVMCITHTNLQCNISSTNNNNQKTTRS